MEERVSRVHRNGPRLTQERSDSSLLLDSSSRRQSFETPIYHGTQLDAYSVMRAEDPFRFGFSSDDISG